MAARSPANPDWTGGLPDCMSGLDVGPDCLARGNAYAMCTAVFCRRFVLGPRRGVGVSRPLSP
eukprot:16122127-Heterocapsa_arctica.AAC.1